MAELVCVLGLSLLVGSAVIGGAAAGLGGGPPHADASADDPSANASLDGGATVVAGSNETDVRVRASPENGSGRARVDHDAIDGGFERGVRAGACVVGFDADGPVTIAVDGEAGVARIRFDEGPTDASERFANRTADARGIVERCAAGSPS